MQELFTFTPFASSGDGFNLSATEKDGQAWFIAADVCRNLEIKNYRDAVAKLDDDEKGVGIADTLGGRQQLTIINESGLYSLAFTSRKEAAKRFRKWVTNVVLPNLRKHGGYINGQEALRPEAQAELLPAVHALAQTARERLEEEREARHNALRLPTFGSSKGAKKAAKIAAEQAAYLAECERIGLERLKL